VAPLPEDHGKNLYLLPSGSGARRSAGAVELENLVTAGHGLGASLARATISGPHGPTMNTRCNRVYFFLSGACAMRVGASTFNAHIGDTVIVPAGTKHELNGMAEYIVVNIPGFDPDSEVALK
jgi:mannose-6-phosphate isomerase-like protein (cupin superfamily)